MTNHQHYDTIVIGGGQAGLATAYYLQQQERDFIVLDAGERVGDCWRNRWDSLELFTAAQYNSLPGMQFPAPDNYYPAKDEMADYLEAYVQHFDLPIQLESRVQKVSRTDNIYTVQTQQNPFTSQNVVIATGAYPKPYIPEWAEQLDASIQQIHTIEYRNPQQLQDGSVLVVGAGSSGTQIALDIVPERQVSLAGRYGGYIPRWLFGIDVFGVLIRTVFYFSVDTWIGRRIRKKMKSKGMPVVDIRESEVVNAGVERLPRVVGVRNGKPVVEDGRTVDTDIIIWGTGFRHNYDWIDLPVFDDKGMPDQYRGVVDGEPGLYFMGLPFMYRGKSPLVCGVSADAEYIVNQLTARSPVHPKAAHQRNTTEPQIA